LDGLRELLDAATLDGGGYRVAAHEVAEPQEPVVAEVLVLGGVGVDRVLVEVEVHRGADRETGVQPSTQQHVDGAEVLGEPEGVLGPDRRDRGAEVDPRGPLRGRGQHRHGGGDAVLQVAVPEPGAVETEDFGALDHPQRVLVALRRSGGVERADGQEAESLQGSSVEGHVPMVPDGQRAAPGSPESRTDANRTTRRTRIFGP